jgi:hypothetical protein
MDRRVKLGGDEERELRREDEIACFINDRISGAGRDTMQRGRG